MKYLYLKNINQFEDFGKKLSLNKWSIYNLNIQERTEAIIETEYYNNFFKIAIENDIIADETEIVSWLDTSSILYRMITTSNIAKKLIGLNVIAEYKVPFSNKRIDYLLILDNKILILEFSFNKWYNKEYQYQYKFNQVVNYKELLTNILPKHIEIATYTFIIDPEYDFINNKKIKIDTCDNYNKIENLKNFILFYFKDTKKSAQQELYKIDNNI